MSLPFSIMLAGGFLLFSFGRLRSIPLILALYWAISVFVGRLAGVVGSLLLGPFLVGRVGEGLVYGVVFSVLFRSPGAIALASVGPLWIASWSLCGRRKGRILLGVLLLVFSVLYGIG